MKRDYTITTLLLGGMLQLVISCFSTYAQENDLSQEKQQKIDSFRRIIETTNVDTTKVKALNDLSWTYMGLGQYDNALQAAKDAKNLAEQGGNQSGIGRAYNNIGITYWYQGQYDRGLEYFYKALEIRKENGNRKGVASSYGNIGLIHKNRGEYDQALEYYFKGLDILKNINNKKSMTNFYINIGVVYRNQGRYEKALEYYYKALQIDKQRGNKAGMSTCYLNMGNIYKSQGRYDRALEYYHKALTIDEQSGDREGMAHVYNNMGIIHKIQGYYDRALEYYRKGLKIRQQMDDPRGIAASYNNLGIIHKERGHYDQALKYHRKSLQIKEEVGDQPGLARSYNNIGALYIALYENDSLKKGSRELKREIQQYYPYALLDSARHYLKSALQLAHKTGHQSTVTNASLGLGGIVKLKKHYEEALPYYHKAARMADSTGARPRLYEAYKGLSECYKELGQYQKAYEYHVKYAAIQDSVHSVESKEKIAQMEQQYKAEKRQRKIAEQEAELQRQRLWLYGAGGGLLLFLLFSGILYNRFRVIRRQKQTIETAHHTLEQKNREITASINYAKRIQDALLKEEELVTPDLPPHFVLLKPQATVSGDFHWGVKKENYWYIAAADCTGHGVPGGFLTMLGSAFLNEITSKPGQLQPATILNELRERFIKELGEEEKEADTGMRMRDGMDISLLRLNLKTNEAQWAGANNSLYVIRHKNKASIDEKEMKTLQKGEEQLYDIPPDKQPISYTQDPQPFTNHKLKLQKNDSLYMFSDGYPDQFGGPRGKKFMYKRFKRLLCEIQEKSVDQQKQYLDETIEDWMAENEEEQIDDICILGIRME